MKLVVLPQHLEVDSALVEGEILPLDLFASARGKYSDMETDDRSSAGTPRPGYRRRTTLEQLGKLAGSPTESTFIYSISSSSPRSERLSE